LVFEMLTTDEKILGRGELMERKANWNLRTEIKTEEDLLPPGAPVGTVPTDLDQSTGLERLEILGKMAGVDVFDMKPLDASRRGERLRPRLTGRFQALRIPENRYKKPNLW
jgi:hypothetical protein